MESIKYFTIAIMLLIQICSLKAFVLDKLEVDDNVYREMASCDRRSERVGKFVVAKALKQKLQAKSEEEYLTTGATKTTELVITRGDIVDVEVLPTTSIPTGHSCSWRSKAKNGKKTLKMTRQIQKLDYMIDPDDLAEYKDGSDYLPSLADGIVAAEALIDTEIEVWKGHRLFFGACNKLWQKTCQSHAIARGNIGVSVELSATGFDLTTVPGKLCFHLDTEVTMYSKETHWGKFEVKNSQSCNLLRVFGLTLSSMNGRIDTYARTYVKLDKIKTINSARLTEKLESVLEQELKTRTCVPLVDKSGNSYKAPSGSKSARKSGGSCPASCPHDFVHLSRKGVCQKSMGRDWPNCSKFPGAYLYGKKRGRRTSYYCRMNL